MDCFLRLQSLIYICLPAKLLIWTVKLTRSQGKPHKGKSPSSLSNVPWLLVIIVEVPRKDTAWGLST